MKFLIVDTYYSRFLNQFYKKNNTANLSYGQHIKALTDQLFGTSDYYSYYLSQLGHTAFDVIANDKNLQHKWATEHHVKVKTHPIIDQIRALPYIYRFLGQPEWIQTVVMAQIKHYQPDIVYLQNLSIIGPDILSQIKQHCRLLVGQIACPLPPYKYLKPLDLILTSFPHYPKMFRHMGIQSEYFKIGFDPRVLKKIGKQKKIYDTTFIGSFTPYHHQGTRQLEALAAKTPVHVWGQGLEFLPPNSPLKKNYHGEAWGREMYEILAQSKIVINRHISAASKYANNMRLYESTGMGAMLITDYKVNLKRLFKVNSEVGVYRNSSDLIKQVTYYLSHEQIRKKIALAGQKRTIAEHNYKERMTELVQIISKYL